MRRSFNDCFSPPLILHNTTKTMHVQHVPTMMDGIDFIEMACMALNLEEAEETATAPGKYLALSPAHLNTSLCETAFPKTPLKRWHTDPIKQPSSSH
jgi:hypothetical protein